MCQQVIAAIVVVVSAVVAELVENHAADSRDRKIPAPSGIRRYVRVAPVDTPALAGITEGKGAMDKVRIRGAIGACRIRRPVYIARAATDYGHAIACRFHTC